MARKEATSAGLFGMRQNARARVPKKQQETWHPATMKLPKERALEKKQK
jgi:hypothetical protein